MSKPVIGLTTTRLPDPFKHPTFATNEPYARAIVSAGGIPILIPISISNEDAGSLLNKLDGVLFTGGYDIEPRLYSSQPHPKVIGIDTERDRIECHLVQACVVEDKPFLGICRGIQVVNVALGGSLYEHLPEQHPGDIQHDNHDKPRNFLAHEVKIEKDSRLGQILPGKQVPVNSLHHQGVRQPSSHLRATAHAPDGLIEALEVPGARFGIAVQWHPEELQEHDAMRRLFEAFVQACHDNQTPSRDR